MDLIKDYFVIESLKSSDIHDGKILHDALKSLNRYEPIYRKVKTNKDFEKALLEFENSGYRYLFISAHGDEEHITLLEEKFNAYDLEELEIDLTGRRVFLSTCNGGSYLLARPFIKKGVYSVIGAPDKLDQIVATGLWPTMAFVFEGENDHSLNFDVLNGTLKRMVKIYKINLTYYSFIGNSRKKMKEYIYKPDGNREKEKWRFD